MADSLVVPSLAAADVVLSGVDGAVIALDRSGAVHFANDEAVRVLGEGLELGCTVWQVFPNVAVRAIRAAADEALSRRGRCVGTDLVQLKGARWRVVVRPTAVGCVIHLLDATEQWNREERARQLEDEASGRDDELDRLLVSRGAVVSYVDKDLRYTRVLNLPARYPASGYRGKRAYEFAETAGGQAVAAFQLEVLESGRRLMRELQWDSGDGERYWWFYGEPLWADDRSIRGVKTISLEVTSLRNAETAASTDYLTGVLNRRAMSARVRQEVQRAARYGSVFSVVFLDIDHFKRVNDVYGHSRGDQVLRECVERLGEALRDADSMARWGGEEFLVLLPETGREEAATVAERMRQSVEARPFSTIGHLTISLGVATTCPSEHAEDLIDRASMACLEAKRHGRNTVVQAFTGSGASEGDVQPVLFGYGRP